MNPAKDSDYSEFSTLITKHIKVWWKKLLEKALASTWNCLRVSEGNIPQLPPQRWQRLDQSVVAEGWLQEKITVWLKKYHCSERRTFTSQVSFEMRRKIRIECLTLSTRTVIVQRDDVKGKPLSLSSVSLFPQLVRADIETLKRNNANGIVRISKINSGLSVFSQVSFYLFLKDCWCPGCTIAAGAKFNWWIESIF